MKKGPFKMKIKPVGPIATKRKVKRDSKSFTPGYEDPMKIQKVQREGITPYSQKFGKLAFGNRKR
tara:strand:+ start:52 stop:246 length:195 start_codon:yes stop_codon:yes gene_type:complete